ncbi:MAG: energy transducer TonB [Bacteroidetes bacterium]|nr:energy transducer TonB [Bacteroidota bacterium]MDA0936765.1 energy transducer TonB [Bacteroidota bacterium]
MKYLKTPHEKKSAAVTMLITALLILLFFLLGLKYQDPPISFGMEVNFGTATQGKGKTQPQKSVATKPTPIAQPEKPTPKAAPKKTAQSKVATQDQSDVAVPAKNEKTPPAPKKEEPKKIEPPKPKVDQSTKNILSKLVNQKNTEEKPLQSGEGDDDVEGDKGKMEGNPYANSYFNLAGPGGMGKGFGLNGRRLESRGKVTQLCNQEGVVVVRITVNRQGDVVQAEPGVKGTTNTHPCLLQPAKATAMLHKWFPDAKAPSQQIGFVVIQFKLGE